MFIKYVDIAVKSATFFQYLKCATFCSYYITPRLMQTRYNAVCSKFMLISLPILT